MRKGGLSRRAVGRGGGPAGLGVSGGGGPVVGGLRASRGRGRGGKPVRAFSARRARQRQPYGHGGNVLLTLCLDTFNLLKLYVNVHLML